MYYIIETNYVGPNRTQDQYVDVDTIVISTSPAMTNLSHVTSPAMTNLSHVDSNLENFMRERRQELRDEQEDAA